MMWRESRIVECSSDVGCLFDEIAVTWTTNSCTPKSRSLLREQALPFVVSYSRPCGRWTTETTSQTVLTSESDWHKVYVGQCTLPVARLLGTASWSPSSFFVNHYYFLYALFRFPDWNIFMHFLCSYTCYLPWPFVLICSIEAKLVLFGRVACMGVQRGVGFTLFTGHEGP